MVSQMHAAFAGHFLDNQLAGGENRALPEKRSHRRAATST